MSYPRHRPLVTLPPPPSSALYPAEVDQEEHVPDTPEILNTIITLQQQQQQPRSGVLPQQQHKGCSTSSSGGDLIASQLVKEGLRMKVRENLRSTVDVKRLRRPLVEVKKEVAGEAAAEEEGKTRPPPPKLHDSDERRLRRRARNKIAATKCREKKKMRAQMLAKVSACTRSLALFYSLTSLATSRSTSPCQRTTSG